MKLNDLLGVIEMAQDVSVYKVGEDGCRYHGLAAHVPDKLKRLNVESVHAYDWEIDILVS